MAREKHFVKVCSCTSRGDLCIMDLRVLNQIVRDEEASIAREKNARSMARRALLLGDTCMAAGCPIKAIRIWRTAAQRLLVMDYHWVDVPLYYEAYTSFDHLVSEKEGIILGRRIDKAWHLLGHREMATWARHMRIEYHEMWLDRYYEALP
jgi:hypothetical protein